MKPFIVITSAVLLLSSCKQAELDQSNRKNDSLATVIQERESDINERESSINEFIASFNEVERNLDCVAVKQKIIYVNSDKLNRDLKSNKKDHINSQINAINKLMSSNRETISELNRKLKGSAYKNVKLQEMLANLTNQLAQKDTELNDLNEKLNSLNAQVAQLQTSVETLSAQNDTQSKTIVDNTMAMHTAYYIIGKPKDLAESKLIDRKGGLLGIGKTSKLSENFDNSKFIRIDYTQISIIPVNSDHVRIITSHPSDSYKFEKDMKDKDVVKNLIISNAEKFWGISKYLVIEGSPVSVDNSLSAKNK